MVEKEVLPSWTHFKKCMTIKEHIMNIYKSCKRALFIKNLDWF